MKRSCPQGSIIGSAAWNWTMNDLLSGIEIDPNENKLEAIAYPDDLATLIKANSRCEIELLGSKVIQKIENWYALYKLKIFATKTTAMIVKTKFNKERVPILKIDSFNVKYSSEVKYLG